VSETVERRVSVIWHDLECGGYAEDMAVWRALANEYGDPVLDVGAGTGRIALDLARRGHRVTALDRDDALLGELSPRRRVSGRDGARRRAPVRARAALRALPGADADDPTARRLGGPNRFPSLREAASAR
jgi:precorrin-6B methylase 2